MTWSKDLIENITDIGELEAKLRFDRRLTQQMRALCEKFPMSVTRYYLSLIDWSDTDDPIRRMSIPTFLETDMQKTIMMADHTKFDRTSFVKYCSFQQIDILVTDRRPADEWMELLEEYQIRILYPEAGDTYIKETGNS